MNLFGKNEAAADRPAGTKQTLAVLAGMGRVMAHENVYGGTHKLTQQSLQESYAALSKLLEGRERVQLAFADGKLQIDGQWVEPDSRFAETFIEKLGALDITGFSFVRGMSEEEFIDLLEFFIYASPTDTSDVGEAMAARGVKHVEMEKAVYQRVAEGQTVVDEGGAEQDGGAGAGGDEGEAEDGPSPAAVEQIMAFLKGEDHATDAPVPEELKEVANDAEKLASLIMEATAVRQRQADIEGGENLTDFVVGCLRRTYGGLMKAGAGKTQKGRRDMKKSLLLLEKDVLDRLHSLVEETDPEADAAIAAAIEEMQEDLEVDSLATEYVKRRKALEKMEHRMVRYMDRRDDAQDPDGPLHDKLQEAGLGTHGWRELVAKTADGAGSGGDGGPETGGASNELATLTTLLTQLETMMSSQEPQREQQANQILAQAEEKLEELGRGTQEKIRRLGEDMELERQAEEFAGVSLKKPVLSRGQRAELLAEICQEICQPASVINVSIEMLAYGLLGELTEAQSETLGLAADCGRKLMDLLDLLRDVVGVPKGLTPEKPDLST